MFRFNKMLARRLRMICYCRADKPTKERKKEMKNNIIKYLASTALAVGIVGTVQATPITGSIGFTGSYTQNGGTAGNLASATSFTIVNTLAHPIVVFDAMGMLTGAAAPITFASPITVNFSPGNGNLVFPSDVQLWSATVSPLTYSLLVTTEMQTFTSGIQINLAGNGTLRDGTAGDDTPGTWQIGFGVTGSSFTWQSTSGSSLPDGGTTAMLLGAALSGLALLRRKIA